MWIKSFDDLKGCFTEDGNFHSVYIVNDDLYIDGVKIYTGNIGKIKVFSHALSDDEVSAEYQTAQQAYTCVCHMWGCQCL